MQTHRRKKKLLLSANHHPIHLLYTFFYKFVLVSSLFSVHVIENNGQKMGSTKGKKSREITGEISEY